MTIKVIDLWELSLGLPTEAPSKSITNNATVTDPCAGKKKPRPNRPQGYLAEQRNATERQQEAFSRSKKPSIHVNPFTILL
jgi:hypothetical protein